MKKLLLSVFSLASFITANAQCSDLFISEYSEGSNNNKAIEIYNPTQSAIALNNNYRLIRYSYLFAFLGGCRLLFGDLAQPLVETLFAVVRF